MWLATRGNGERAGLHLNKVDYCWPFYYFHVLSTTICVTFESYCSKARYAAGGYPAHRGKRYYFHVLSTTILCYLWILLFRDCFSHSQTFTSIDLACFFECSVWKEGERRECTQTEDLSFCYFHVLSTTILYLCCILLFQEMIPCFTHLKGDRMPNWEIERQTGRSNAIWSPSFM